MRAFRREHGLSAPRLTIPRIFGGGEESQAEEAQRAEYTRNPHAPPLSGLRSSGRVREAEAEERRLQVIRSVDEVYRMGGSGMHSAVSHREFASPQHQSPVARVASVDTGELSRMGSRDQLLPQTAKRSRLRSLSWRKKSLPVEGRSEVVDNAAAAQAEAPVFEKRKSLVRSFAEFSQKLSKKLTFGKRYDSAYPSSENSNQDTLLAHLATPTAERSPFTIADDETRPSLRLSRRASGRAVSHSLPADPPPPYSSGNAAVEGDGESQLTTVYFMQNTVQGGLPPAARTGETPPHYRTDEQYSHGFDANRLCEILAAWQAMPTQEPRIHEGSEEDGDCSPRG